MFGGAFDGWTEIILESVFSYFEEIGGQDFILGFPATFGLLFLKFSMKHLNCSQLML